MDAAAYCRDVEAYLCQQNDGHLIRIVGPAFEMVSGWAARGVPLKVVCRGIDRRVSRYHAKGPRRRPLRIEFCEADVLDQFDEWRRAVGVTASSRGSLGADAERDPDARVSDRRRPPGLPTHLHHVMARLTTLLVGSEPWPGAHAALDGIVRELDTIRAAAKSARGAARTRLLDRLATLDHTLLEAIREGADRTHLEALREDAMREMAPFRARMAPAALEHALDRCTDRMLRDALGVPRLRLD